MKTPFVKSIRSFGWALVLTAAVAGFSACNNDDDDDNQNPTPQLNTTDQQFMQTAKLGNNAEIQTSRLALTNSQDTSVRSFAQMMITHHTAANRSLDSLAGLRKVTLPDSSQLDSSARAMVTMLTSMKDSTGTGIADSVAYSFSRAYISGQVQAHTKAQTDYQSYINNSQAQDAGVKGYATKTLPLVQSHLQEAQTIQNSYSPQ
jgi:putative membrane protein